MTVCSLPIAGCAPQKTLVIMDAIDLGLRRLSQGLERLVQPAPRLGPLCLGVQIALSSRKRVNFSALTAEAGFPPSGGAVSFDRGQCFHAEQI